MTSNLARQKAAQAWCKETTKHIEMDVALAEAFAEILDELLPPPETRWECPFCGREMKGLDVYPNEPCCGEVGRAQKAEVET